MVVGALVVATFAISMNSKPTNVSGARYATPFAIPSAIICVNAAVIAVILSRVGIEEFTVLDLISSWMTIDTFRQSAFAVLALAGGMSCLFAGGYPVTDAVQRQWLCPLMLLTTASAMVFVASVSQWLMLISFFVMLACVCAIIWIGGTATAKKAALGVCGVGIAVIALYTTRELIANAIEATTLTGSASVEQYSRVSLVGLMLTVAAMLLVVGAVPFHVWINQASVSTIAPVAAFVDVVWKTATIAVMGRVLLSDYPSHKYDYSSWGSGWPPVVATFAVISIAVGSTLAMRVRSMKRMLASLSVTHTGLLLIAILLSLPTWTNAPDMIIDYLWVYSVATIGAHSALYLCGNSRVEVYAVSDLAGIARCRPATALPLSVFLLSLAGLWPLGGYWIRLVLVEIAVELRYFVLAAVVLLSYIAMMYCYLRPVVWMYMKESPSPADESTRSMSVHVVVVVACAAALILSLGNIVAFVPPIAGVLLCYLWVRRKRERALHQAHLARPAFDPENIPYTPSRPA